MKRYFQHKKIEWFKSLKMKHLKSPIFLLAFFIYINSSAQVRLRIRDTRDKSQTYVRTLYQGDTNSLYMDTLRFNRKYKYVLQGVNRFIFKEATAIQEGKNLNATVPSIFSTIKLPGFLSKPIGSVAAVPEGEEGSPLRGKDQKKPPKKRYPPPSCSCTPLPKIIGEGTNLGTTHETFLTQLERVKRYAQLFSSGTTLNRELEGLKNAVNKPYILILSEKKNLFQQSLGLKLDTFAYNNEIVQAFSTIHNQTQTLISDSLAPNAQRLIDAISKELGTAKLCYFTSHQVLRCMDNCKDSDFDDWEMHKFTTKQCIDQLEQATTAISKDLETAVTSLKSMGDVLAQNDFSTLQNNYNLLAPNNFELELETFIADKDIHDITFTTGAEGPLPFGRSSKRTIKVHTITSGGWRIDFSTGTFYNWGSNEFLGPDYYYEAQGGNTRIIREATRTKKGMFSIGGLLHCSPRLLSMVRPALSVGVSATTGFDAINFHGGFSVLLGNPGKPNRIVLSGGITLRQVSLLDNRFRIDVPRDDYPDEIPISNNFPISGGFFSISYNLSGISK